MLPITLLSGAARRSGLDFLWRATALGLALSAILLAWILRPRSGVTADTVLAAALTTVAALLAAAALAGRGTAADPLRPCRVPSDASAPAGAVWADVALRAA